MNIAVMTRTVFAILVLGISIKGYSAEYTVNDIKIARVLEEGKTGCYIRFDDNVHGFHISMENKKIKVDSVWAKEEENSTTFNQAAYKIFIQPFLLNPKKEPKIISLSDNFTITDPASPSTQETLKKYPESYEDKLMVNSKVSSDTVKGNQKWKDNLIVSEKSMKFLGTQFDCESTGFGFKDYLFFARPDNIDSDIEGLIITKLPGYDYIYMNGMIDFLNPNLFIPKEGKNFFIQGAQDIEIVFNQKVLLPFTPMTVVLANGIKIERLTKNSLKIGNVNLFSKGTFDLSGSTFSVGDQSITVSNFHLPMGATKEEFLKAVTQGFGPIAQIITTYA